MFDLLFAISTIEYSRWDINMIQPNVYIESFSHIVEVPKLFSPHIVRVVHLLILPRQFDKIDHDM